MKYRISQVFLYGSISRAEFDMIRPLVWGRNRKILKITSLLAMVMGAVFLAYALITHSGTWLPYLILLLGSMVIHAVNLLTGNIKSIFLSVALCYMQMMLVCFYAGVLSVQQSNYAIPATSVVVFIAILPLSIDDRLLRMFCFMLLESGVYLLISNRFKSPEAFSLDCMNVATFCIVGMILYGVICTRNIREIYQGIRIERIQRNIISSMATVVEERDENTGGHIARTEEHVSRLIEMMKKTDDYPQLTRDYCNNILLAAPMHDIGKIKIPDSILNKPGRLTEEEFEIMKKHSEFGAEIIRKTMEEVEEKEYFDIAVNIAKFHHERYDGNGYPSGLKGTEIPLEARIMALADVYDALISERVYKNAFSHEEAKRIIEEGSGTKFDPELTALFLKCID